MNINRQIAFNIMMFGASIFLPCMYIPYVMGKHLLAFITLGTFLVFLIIHMATRGKKGKLPFNWKQRSQPLKFFVLFVVSESMYTIAIVMAFFNPIFTWTWLSVFTIGLCVNGVVGLLLWVLITSKEFLQDED